ncbi:MAG: large conductance mechanosensitive channel protein MscL [Chloroflexota bacterium]|nr:large conductance mechanosensitive channel protein MscL [Chloroflexota bacterium]
MLGEFRNFILRGNVVDLAVGIVIGAAFTAIINSLVADLLTPLIGIIFSADFSAMSVTVNGSTITYGRFLNALVSFLLVGAALFFFIVKPMNLLERRRQSTESDAPTTKTCTECASEIPLAARRCPMCTAPQTATAAGD